MKIYDFDAKFFDYVRTWMALHPGLKENEVEERYNELMRSWLNAPAKWLDGVKPGEYFDRYSEPKDLLKLLEEYMKRDIGLPEPLYRRIAEVGAPCVDGLMKMADNTSNAESLRSTALALLADIGGVPVDFYVNVMCREDIPEVQAMAADALKNCGAEVVDTLMARYDAVPAVAQEQMLEICAAYPGDERVYERLVSKLRNCPDDRAMYAALLGKFGDPRAIEPLKQIVDLTDVNYLDYIELRNAIEQLGGDPGEERIFNGDPFYEALRNI